MQVVTFIVALFCLSVVSAQTCTGEGTACDDGNYCTTNDICTNGNCAGVPLNCQSTNQCQLDGACYYYTRGCDYPQKPAGTPCDDGNACTTGDNCNGGSCSPGTPVVCTSPNSCKVNGVCNPVNGTCSFTDVTCSPQPCKNGACDPATGQCAYTDVTCPPQPCKNGACDPATGQCAYTDVICPIRPCNTGSCDRTSGQCTYTPIQCDRQACQVGTCNPTTGSCSYTPAAEGTGCDDSSLCTTNDRCQGGVCKGDSVVCPVPTQCQKGTGNCNSLTGQCTYQTYADGTGCDDGDICTPSDTCKSGVCVPGTNMCCRNIHTPKSKCGICVKDCGNEAHIVLDFFGLPGTEQDVSGAYGGGGACKGPDVCCTPKDQSIFTYDGPYCVGRKTKQTAFPV